MLSNTAKNRPDYPALLLAASILVAGCSTSPTSGRTQFNILPAPLESSVSDLRFGVKTMLGAGDYCGDREGPCVIREEAEKLANRIAPIAERLGAVAPQLSPELVTRVPRVEVFVVPSESAAVSSSGGGKIAVDAGIGKLDLSDTDLALALAREFGRLAAAHHRESTSAGLAVSLVAGSPLVGTYLATSILADLLFPMGSLVKLGISLLGSIGTEQLVEASQQEEADEFAGKLMLAAGYDLRELDEARPDSPESTASIGWLPTYFTSRAKVAAMAQPDPWPDEAPTLVTHAVAPDPWPDEAPTLVTHAVAPEPWPDEAQPLVTHAAAPEPWPDEAQPPVVLAVAPEPWPDEALAMPPQDETPKAGQVVVAQLAAPAPEAGKTAKPQEAPPKPAAAKAQGAKKKAAKRTKKKIRRTPKKSKRR